jgi:hypothetical protein
VSETDLAPLSVDAAIAHLETIDSPFYVFRNKVKLLAFFGDEN